MLMPRHRHAHVAWYSTENNGLDYGTLVVCHELIKSDGGETHAAASMQQSVHKHVATLLHKRVGTYTLIILKR